MVVVGLGFELTLYDKGTLVHINENVIGFFLVLQIQIPSGKISITGACIVRSLVTNQIPIVLHDEETVTSVRVPAALPKRILRVGFVDDRDVAIIAQLNLIGPSIVSASSKRSLSTFVFVVNNKIPVLL